MSRINWTQVGVFSAVVLIILVLGMTFLAILFGGYGGWSMVGSGMVGRGWSAGWCPFCSGTGRSPGGFFGGIFSWVFTLAAMLFPLGLLVLLALGIVWLIRAVGRPLGGIARSPETCPSCGRPVAADWRLCPHCGEELQAPQ